MEKIVGGTPPPHRTLAVNAWGLPGVGKSTFGLTFPPPLYILNCDRSIRPLIADLPPTHEIFYEEFLLAPGDTMDKAKALVYQSKFEGLVALALGVGAGTIFIDGGNRLWDIIKWATLPSEALGGSDRRAWEIPNSYWKSYFLALEASPLQMCITHPAGTVWESMTKESERLRPDAFKHLRSDVTAEIYLFTTGRPSDLYPKIVENAAITGLAPGGTQHWGMIWLDKYNTAIEQRAIPGLTFPLLYQMTFGEPWDGAECWTP